MIPNSHGHYSSGLPRPPPAPPPPTRSTSRGRAGDWLSLTVMCAIALVVVTITVGKIIADSAAPRVCLEARADRLWMQRDGEPLEPFTRWTCLRWADPS